MTSLTLQFFSQGFDHPDIEKQLSSKYPYSVTRNAKEAPTAQNVEAFLTEVQKEPLQKRVQINPNTPKVAVVDGLFQVKLKSSAVRIKAVDVWSELRSGSRTIGILSGVAVVGLILLSLQDLPIDIVVSLYVSAVASCCFAGWSLQKYRQAEKELAVWERPGEDFAQKRKGDLGLPLHQISQKQCHYHSVKQEDGSFLAAGSLFGVEILFIFKREFESFAKPLLEAKCDTPEQKKQWVTHFFKANPLAIKFFVDNPHLKEDEAGWNTVEVFQKQFDQLMKLKEDVEKIFKTDHETAKQKHDEILKAFEVRAQEVITDQKITPLFGDYYLGKVRPVLKKECLDKISPVYEEHSKQQEALYPEVYLQIRPWLEHARKVLQGMESTFDANGFADPAKFFPKDFQPKLDAVTANYQQKVIAKAKRKNPNNVQYCAFVDAVFALKPLA
jgi:hypothetical protein